MLLENVANNFADLPLSISRYRRYITGSYFDNASNNCFKYMDTLCIKYRRFPYRLWFRIERRRG